MRTKGLLWVVGILGPWAVFAGACGDDSPQGGGGSGGETTIATSTTDGSTVSTVASTSDSSTTQASSSTGLGGGDNESCPGQNVTLTPGNSITLTGSTANAEDDFTTFCGTGTSPDVVYSINLPQDCSLSIEGAGSGGFNPIVSLRFSECEMRMPEDLCSNGVPIVRHQPAGTVTLIVDGIDGSSGDYSIDVACGAPTCGDLILNPGEECDLGQGIPDDTCSDTCTAEGADAAPNCAALNGPAISIPAGETVLPEMAPWYTTAGAGDETQGSCGGTGAPEQVFAFTPEVSGSLAISTALDLGGNPVCVTFMEPECWFSIMYVRQADCENGNEVGCSFISTETGVHQLNLNVTAGQTYYLFVDGLDDMFYSKGPYTLHFNLQ